MEIIYDENQKELLKIERNNNCNKIETPKFKST